MLLNHEQGYSICSFLDIGQRLAARGYHVLIPEFREHGASETNPANEHVDRDARAALSELKRLGAQRVFLGGASCGGTTAALAGADGDLPIVGLLIMSSPARCDGDGVAAVRKINAPSLFVVSPDDHQGAMEREVRRLHAASAARDKRLIIDKRGRHGTDMISMEGARGVRLRTEVLEFIEAAYGKAR